MIRATRLALTISLAFLSACAAPQADVKAPGGGFAFAVVSVRFTKPASREQVMALDRVLRARERIGTMTRDEDGLEAKVLYIEPTTINFPALAGDAAQQGLKVGSFQLRTEGVIVEHYCEACLAERRFLKLLATGQEFELESAKSQVGERVLMAGEIKRWTTGRHLRLAATGETKQD